MKLRDAYGSIWESDGEGGWEHNPFTSHYDYCYLPNREVLEGIFGPLTEVED